MDRACYRSLSPDPQIFSSIRSAAAASVSALCNRPLGLSMPSLPMAVESLRRVAYIPRCSQAERIMHSPPPRKEPARSVPPCDPHPYYRIIAPRVCPVAQPCCFSVYNHDFRHAYHRLLRDSSTTVRARNLPAQSFALNASSFAASSGSS